MDGPVGAYLRKATAEKTGIYMFENIFDSGFRQITSSTHPIRTAADFAGFRIRVPEIKMWVDLFKGLGSSPTPIAAPELYTALQTKTVDGQDNPLNTVETARYFEVQKYLSITNHSWAGDWLAINGDAWAKLPADIKAIVQKHARTAVALERGDSARLDAALAEKITRQGLVTNVADYNSCKAKLVASGFYTGLKEQFGPQAWSLLEAAIGKVG
jgi:TRAP-type C4-dicarboxylate transport system substrate-binding protein